MDLREIELQSDGYGRPAIQLHGELAARVGDLRVHVSLSHEGSMAAAVVVIEGGVGCAGGRGYRWVLVCLMFIDFV